VPQATIGAVQEAFALATAVVLVAFLIVWIALKRDGKRLSDLLRDKDDRPSLARIQVFAWTLVIGFVFTWFYFIRLRSGVAAPPPEIPGSTLALMGISVGSSVASGTVPRLLSVMKTGRHPWRKVFLEEDRPSLARVQMFFWTVVAIIIYLWVVWLTVSDPIVLAAVEGLALPNVDPSLPILMGLSQSGYVGGKAVRALQWRSTPSARSPPPPAAP